MSAPESSGGPPPAPVRRRSPFLFALALFDFAVALACAWGAWKAGVEALRHDQNETFIALAVAAAASSPLFLACSLGVGRRRPWGLTLQRLLALVVLLLPAVLSLAYGGFPVTVFWASLLVSPLLLVAGFILVQISRASVGEAFAPPPGRPSAAPETPAEVVGFALVLTISTVLAITIQDSACTVRRGKQKRTMSDMRTIGIAVESYQVDHGFIPRVGSSPDAAAALAPFLEPTYIKLLPRYDGWGDHFRLRASDGSYSIVSRGKDGVDEVEVSAGPTTGFDADIYFSNGLFSRYPAGTQRQP